MHPLFISLAFWIIIPVVLIVPMWISEEIKGRKEDILKQSDQQKIDKLVKDYVLGHGDIQWAYDELQEFDELLS